MKNFTVIRNELLESSQLSVPAKLLMISLLRFAGKGSSCYPSQKKLAEFLNVSPRQVRTILKELYDAGLVLKRRFGFNKTNTYVISKSYAIKRDGNSTSAHIGSAYPLTLGSVIPTINTNRKKEDKNMSTQGLELLRETVGRIGNQRSYLNNSIKKL